MELNSFGALAEFKAFFAEFKAFAEFGAFLLYSELFAEFKAFFTEFRAFILTKSNPA